MDTRTVHIPVDLFIKLRQIAVDQSRTTPQQLRVIIKEWMEKTGINPVPKP